ncbi:MAG: hypothetical protein B7Y45_14255 [Sphingomonas sp. 28-66-16]|nr:MAG: hypothetical protein B7Y45_14255 [Sphingomonas sp. 28-66-16]
MTDSPSLTCYVFDGWQPKIRPASPRRDWMESSPERYAYRCLPLVMANSHGWEVLNSTGFRACWHGGSSAGSVEIIADPGSDPARVPVALFGEGTITFHIEGIFRTSPGWNLWVGGSPNEAKDGIAPLGGLIETDWSPYSFTMNWRFTRPDHWISFKIDEPFCHIFPVQRGVLPAIAPEIRPIDEEPALRQAYERWSEARTAFQRNVEANPPHAPADRWQKLYYRGLNPDGGEGAPDHETKLRPAAFACPAASD